mmetsp:Transcript_70788/g.188198  ORF Transcript_70788/g.188198 Transcript_70788/m.188198 type:complete len:210 (-) Transcript_70788:109-738(-)
MPSPLDRDYTDKTGIVDPGAATGEARGRLMPRGVHHLALFTHDMRRTVEFYERVLGMRMRSIFEMHGFAAAKHCFLEAGNGFEISFVQVDDPPPRAAEPGVEIPRNLQMGLDDGRQMPGGTLAHVALRCRDLEELKALRKQVREAGVAITPIMDHGFCYSAYFQDPNGFQLELCTTYRSYNPEEEIRTSLLDKTVPKDTVGRQPRLAKL